MQIGGRTCDLLIEQAALPLTCWIKVEDVILVDVFL